MVDAGVVRIGKVEGSGQIDLVNQRNLTMATTVNCPFSSVPDNGSIGKSSGQSSIEPI